MDQWRPKASLPSMGRPRLGRLRARPFAHPDVSNADHYDSNSRCHTDGAAAWINFTTPQNNLNTVCTNLVGNSGQIGYVVDERRTTCIQVLGGDNAYKWNFDIYRNKCSDFSDNLDFHTCFETLGDILSGYVTFCSGGKIWVIGGHEQVGCFMIS